MNTIKIGLSFALFFLWHSVFSQPLGYYNGTENLTGEELKNALHNIISDHVDFSYNRVKDIINYSDSDIGNPDNVILFYMQESRDSRRYGTGGDYINREHVWARSHGNFSGIRPIDTDAHNIRPADATVNEDRSNKDFDNVQPDGFRHFKATECWYNQLAWEPGPATKGQVARILFYMATRYEDANLEIDLELADKINTFPLLEHGKLSTLMEWNTQYPPSDFERRRNERIYQIQQNRNPFIDNPEFANLIWNNKTPEPIRFSDLKMTPEKPETSDSVTISLKVLSAVEPDSIVLYWGSIFDSEQYQTGLLPDADMFSGQITFRDFNPGQSIYFKVKAFAPNDTGTIRGNYIFPESPEQDEIMEITQVQGESSESPLIGNKVTITGRVTPNFDNTIYIQDKSDIQSGICIFNTLKTGKVGDSIVVSGKVTEYSTLTEITDVEYFFNFGNNQNVEPLVINTSQINEDYEGMLVQIKNVLFEQAGSLIQEENKTFTFFDDFGQADLFVAWHSRLPGKNIPAEKTTVTGIVSQYNGNYQILPREISDLHTPTAASSHFNENKLFTIFPNPVKNELFISPSGEIKSISVFDLNGRLKMTRGENPSVIDISGLNEGIYILRIEDFNQVYTVKKFVVR
jgi:endonuclease I/DNA/RNA endonuclease YhcR with UshA esterase domain